MDNNTLEQIGAMAIELEMFLLLKRNKFKEEVPGPSNENIEESTASISKMQEMSEAIQESVQIKRNENRQVALLNSIEIVGLPDDICENSEDVADVLSQIINIKVPEHSIRGFETVEEFTGPDLGQEGPIDVKSRVLVVHLMDLTLRNYIMSKAQQTHLSFPGSGRVFIYEHLTFINRMIFRKAQQVALQHHIQFVWVQDGKIYARKDENSAIKIIRHDKDVNELCKF